MYESNSNGSFELQKADPSDAHYHKLLEFENNFRDPDDEEKISTKLCNSIAKRIRSFSVKISCIGLFPILKTLQEYNVKEDLPNDVIAGITAGVMMIPQGMAFAALSTLPPIVGLYISFFASLTYFLLGTGKQLSWGCIAILSLMMASILDKYDEKVAGKDVETCANGTDLDTQVLAMPYLYNENSSKGLNTSRLSYESSSIMKTEMSQDEMGKRLEVAGAVSVIAGLVLIAASRVGLSRISCLMSNSLITGFTVGISFHVVTSQVKGILGLSIPRSTGYASIIKTWISIFSKIPETNLATLLISLISMLLIYVVKRYINEKYKKKMRIPIPIELVVVIIATLISNAAEFHTKFSVKVVEDVPMGIPSPKFPDLSLAKDYIGDGVIIIVIAYAQTLAMAKTMGLKHNYVVDSNQEMLACGVVSVVCGLFSGYISASSVSRTVVQDGAGGKTQVASLFASVMVLLVIVVVGRYFYYLPMCVLSSIIIINLRTMFLKLFILPTEWKKSKYDCAVWLFACFSTVILNADMGLLASILFSMMLIIFRSMVSPVMEAGQITTSLVGSQVRSLDHYSAAKVTDCVKIMKINTPLYYVNADIFTSKVFSKSRVDPTKRKRKEMIITVKDPKNKSTINGSGEVADKDNTVQVRMLSEDSLGMTENPILKAIILDAAEVSFIDLMGIQALEFVIKEYCDIGVKVFITGVSESVIAIMQSTGFWKKNGDILFLSIESALASIASDQPS